MVHRVIVLALFGVLGACVPTSYTFSPTTKGESPRKPGPDGCQFTVFRSPPEESFEEVGTLKHYNGDVPTSEGDFKKAVASRVCDVGGHAVYLTGKGFEAATVIKFSKGFHL